METFSNLSDKNLTFMIRGDLFSDGYDLFETSDTLHNMQNIFDKAYLAITEKGKVTEKDRALYKIKATSIREGSLIADLTIYLSDIAQVVIPIMAHYSPTYLWDVTKEGFNYLKTVLQANKEGKTVSISHEGPEGIIINISGDNSAPITINKPSYIFASKSFDYFQNLARKVDGEKVSEIDILDNEDEKKSIRFTTLEKEIFTIETKQDDTPIKLMGRIFRIDTHTSSGKISVISCQDPQLNGQEVTFELQFPEDIRKYCLAIEQDTEYVAYKRIAFDPIKLKDEVKLIKIISINK